MSIYGDMNYYGNLLKVDDSQIFYAYGCSLDNMAGILIIDLGRLWLRFGCQADNSGFVHYYG